jgi:hypothetical protein
MRALVVACLVLAATAAPVAAQDARAVKRVDDLNRAAMEDYDLLELESAKKQLNDALALIKKSRLERHAVAARTHLNLGIVYGAGMGDLDTALLEFRAAIELDPRARLDPAYRSPELQRTFDQALAAVTGKGSPITPTTPGTTESVPALRHTPVEETTAGSTVLVNARVGSDIADRVTQVVLRYRPSGSETFTPSPMRAAGGGLYEGQIPDVVTQGEAVQYFIEARAATGKVMASAGSVDSPHIISIVRSTRRRTDEEPPDLEDPLARRGGDGRGGTGDTQVARRAVPGGKRTLFVGLSAGAGGGYITGETEVSHQGVTCCVAVAPFHLVPELGFWLGRQLALSLVGRIGLPLGANVVGAASLAPAGFLRASYFFGRQGGLYVHGELGGGLIRHTVKLSRTSATTVMGDTDTFATGPLLVGAGTGYVLPLAGPLRFVIDLSVIVGIPIINQLGSGARATKPGFAVHGDLSLGVQLAF